MECVEKAGTVDFGQPVVQALPTREFESLTNEAGLDVVGIHESVEWAQSSDESCWSYTAALAPAGADARQ